VLKICAVLTEFKKGEIHFHLIQRREKSTSYAVPINMK